MENLASHIYRKECGSKDGSSKEAEACGPVYRGGDCSYSSCVYSSDHYHCPVCGTSSAELSQALAHVRTSPACSRDLTQSQYPACSGSMTSDAANSLYNAIYSGLSAPNAFPSASFGGYSQMDTFQWHPSMPVDKVAICSTQLSPCCASNGSGRVQVDSQLCSPMGDLYSKVAAPMKDLISLPAKSGGTSMDSQAWFAAYNSQQMQKPVYKYPDQNNLPQINFLLVDPTDQKHSEMSVLSVADNNMVSSTYSMKTDYSKTDFNGRDLLKESYCAYGAQSMGGLALPEDASSLFSIQLTDDSLKQPDIYHSHQQALLPQMNHSASSSTLSKKSSKGEAITNSAHLLSRFTQEHYGNCMSSCSMYTPLMMPEKGPEHIDENSNQTSSSASDSDESDIIVEDTGDELGAEITESEISIEDIKCSLLQGVVSGEENQHTAVRTQSSFSGKVVIEREKTNKEPEIEVEVVNETDVTTACSGSMRCSVCGVTVTVETPGSFFIQMTSNLPLTSFSQTPILSKLAQIVARNLNDFMDMYGSFICRRCFSLVDSVDSLEIKLESAKHNLSSMFKACLKAPVANDDQCAKLVVDLIEQSHSPLISIPLSEVSTEVKGPLNVTAAVQTVESLLQGQSSLVDACCSTQDITHQRDCRGTKSQQTADVQKNVYLNLPSAPVTTLDNAESPPVDSTSLASDCNQQESNPHPLECKEDVVHLLQPAASSLTSALHQTDSMLEQQLQENQKQPQSHITHHLLRQETHPQQEILLSGLEQNGEDCGNSLQCIERSTVVKDPPSKDSEKSCRKPVQFCCDRCGKGFVTRAGLEGHMPDHDEAVVHLLCDICGKRFHQQKRLDEHISRHLCTKRVHCEVCGKGLSSVALLTVHMRTHTGERPFSCSHCGRAFAHRSNLTAHENICSGQLPFRCDKCNQGFPLYSHLERHVQAVHEGRQSCHCKECGKGFSKPSDLTAHLRVHSVDRAFACQVCGRRYKSLGNLNHHAKIHSEKKPFSCELCNQGFLRKESLEAHINNHKGEKPFKCSQCPKAFWSKSNLATHTKWHSGTLKKNTCPVCNKTFSQKISVHMRTHTGARPYTCEICNHSFSTKSSLNKHNLAKHSSESGTIKLIQSSELEVNSSCPPSC